jgi:hypothetical protein
LSSKTEERLFTAFLLVVILGMTTLSLKYRAPARLVPLWVGVITSLIMGCVAAALFVPRFGRWWHRWEAGSVFSLAQSAADALEKGSRSRRRSEYKILGWLVGLTVAVWLIGFLPAAFLFVLLFLRLAVQESWRLSLIIATIVLVSVYAVFVAALNIPFPTGVLIRYF